MTQYAWIDFTVTFLSVASLLLTFKYIYEVGMLYNEKKLKYARDAAYREQKQAYRMIREQNREYRRELSSVYGN